jgi:hypothetical protein
MCAEGGSNGGGNGSDSEFGSNPSTSNGGTAPSKGWGQDTNGDGKVGFMESVADMFDGGGKGASSSGSVSSTVSDRSTLSSSAPTVSSRPISRPDNLVAMHQAEQDRQAFIENSLSAAGITSSNRYANYTVTDPKTNEVYSPLSAAAQSAMNKAAMEYGATPAGAAYADNRNQINYHMATDRLPTVDQTLIDNATGKNTNLTAEQIAKAQVDLGRALATSKAPGSSYADPMGNLMAPNIAGNANMLGTNTKADEYAANLASGYNKATGTLGGIGGRDLEIDAAGNVGFSSGGSRAVNAIGSTIAGFGLGAINPALGAVASGVQLSSTTPYDNMYSPATTTLSFDPSRAAGSLVMSGVASAAVPAIAKATYNGSNANMALGLGVAGGVGLGTVAGKLAENAVGNISSPMTLGSFGGSTPESNAVALGASAAQPSGFSSRAGADAGNGNGNGGPGGVNAAPDASGSATSGLTAAPTMSASVQSTTGADVGANLTSPGSTDTSSFNSSAFIEQNAGNLTGSSVQPTDLAGNVAANYELNPLFYQPPSGVNYLTAGRQRTDGGVTWAKANSQDAWKSARRAGFGDRIVGTVIG